MAAHQFVVKAKENSVSGGAPMVTGITVTKGQLLTISVPADDTWSAGAADRESNANGLSNPLGGNYGVFTKAPFSFFYGALVGSLDDGKTFFAVGTRMEMSILFPTGRLLLYYWDVNNADNTGSITADVAVYNGPNM
jgi:hypothetical protein